MSGVILSADIGTSSLKAAYIDFNGRLKAFSRAAYRLGASAGDWELAFAQTLESLHEQVPDCEIEGVCISGNGPTLVPVSREGEALPPLYWHDGRIVRPPKGASSSPEGVPASFFLPHAAWFKENAPSEYEKVRFFVSSHEWLACRLGSGLCTVLPQAAYAPYYWDDDQCRLFGLDREKFPPFVKMGSVMGKVSAAAARSFGLKSGIPIIAGGPDFITALIGTGTMKSGDVCDRAGSSEGINVCASGRPEIGAALAEEKNVRVLPHAKKGLWNIGAIIPSSGALFESYRAGTGQEGRAYEELLSELIPPELIPSAMDADGFVKASTSGSGGRVEQGRAVLCAIGLAVRGAVETLESFGFPVKAMRVSGGQGKNPLWNQLKADITGVSLMIPEISDGELAGNAVLAVCALENTSGADEAGFERTLEDLTGRMIRFRKVYEPRSKA